MEPYVDKIVKGFRSRPRLLEASTSSAFGTTRSLGGARALLRGVLSGEEDWGRLRGFGEDHEEVPQPREEFFKFFETRPGQVDEVRGWVDYPRDLDSLLQSIPSSYVEGPRRVKVSAVIEPLKVRLITKGDAIAQWVARFLQKDMWEHLRKFPQFTLIGEPLRDEHLKEILSQEDKVAPGVFDLWVSGDYSAATDGVEIGATKEAFEGFLEKSMESWGGLDLRSQLLLRDLLRGTLYEQELHYPSDIDPGFQKNGQLMGSVLSFPILCVINLIAYWKSLEDYLGKRVPLLDLPVKINGDDILFRSNVDHYEIWKKSVDQVGFRLSLGKNYIHPTILTINSQIFRFRESDRSFQKIPFFNVGLLTGQSKITGREAARLAPLWDLYDEALEGARDRLRAHRRFLHYHISLIKGMTRAGALNLFIDRELGGLGFSNPGDIVPNRVTPLQSFLASGSLNWIYQSVLEGIVPRFPVRLVSSSQPSGLVWSRRRKLQLVPREVYELDPSKYTLPEVDEVHLPYLLWDKSPAQTMDMKYLAPDVESLKSLRRLQRDLQKDPSNIDLEIRILEKETKLLRKGVDVDTVVKRGLRPPLRFPWQICLADPGSQIYGTSGQPGIPASWIPHLKSSAGGSVVSFA
jgi:hypothetical protein